MPDVKWNANDLRALAESVDSIRNAVVYIVERHDREGEYTTASAEDVAKYGLKIVMTCKTTDEESKFVAPNASRAKIKLVGDKDIKLANGSALEINDFDAIFTSLSSVEKFVVPYYAGFKPLVDVEKSRSDFAADPLAVAVLHTPKSVSVVGTVGDRSLFKAVDRARGYLELEEF